LQKQEYGDPGLRALLTVKHRESRKQKMTAPGVIFSLISLQWRGQINRFSLSSGSKHLEGWPQRGQTGASRRWASGLYKTKEFLQGDYLISFTHFRLVLPNEIISI